MSMPSIHNDNTSAHTDTSVQNSNHPTARLVALARPIEAAAFWSAIALPFLYLPLLFNGLSTSTQLTTFFALLGLHALAIVCGHRYNCE